MLLIGALLAVGLASSAPIFIEAVRDLGLRQTLADADPAALDLRFVRANVTADREAVDAVESLINDEVNTAADSLAIGRMTALRTGGYILRTDEQEFDPPDALHATFAAQNDLDDASEIVQGRTPQTTSDTLEVALEADQARTFGLAIGDELLAQPFWLGQPHETRLRIVGLIEPSDDARRWSTLDPIFLPIAARDSELRYWTTREGILGLLAEQSPTLRLSLLQRFRTDLHGASAAEASAAADALQQMTRRIAQSIEGIQQETELVDTLVGFSQRFQFAQSTLLMIVLQLVGAVLVYAVVAAAMLAEQRTEDTAWLRSRGARQRDVAMLHIVEAAILTAPAIALGPLIGMGLVSLARFRSALRRDADRHRRGTVPACAAAARGLVPGARRGRVGAAGAGRADLSRDPPDDGYHAPRARPPARLVDAARPDRCRRRGARRAAESSSCNGLATRSIRRWSARPASTGWLWPRRPCCSSWSG